MQIIFLLGLFFVLINNVNAFSIDSFAADFYSKIQREVETNEQERIISKISEYGELSRSEAKSLLTDNNPSYLLRDKYATQSEIDNILLFVKNEIDLGKLETDMNLNLLADESYANGTLADSPFDLVVDLNILDVIFFGSEAKIPLARWVRDQENKVTPTPPITMTGTNPVNTPKYSPPNQQISVEVAGSPTSSVAGTPKETINIVSELPSVLNPISEIKKSSVSSEQIIGEIHTSNITSENRECRDPEELIFINEKDIKEINISKDKEEKTIYKSQYESTKKDEIFENISNTDVTFDQVAPNTLEDVGKVLEVNFQSQKREECKDPMYGGYFCREKYGPGAAKKESCNPFKDVCKKCFPDDDEIKTDNEIFNMNIQFCITWEFKKSKISLISSTWVEQSIAGYINSSKKVYDKLLSVAPNTPEQNTNQANKTTNPWLRFSDIRMNFYVYGKIPDMWANEPQTKSLTYEALQKQFEEMYLDVVDSDNEFNDLANFKELKSNIFSPLNQKNIRDDITVYKNNLALQQFSYRAMDQKMKEYYGKVESNLQDLKKNFTSFVDRTTNEERINVIKRTATSCKSIEGK